MKNLSLAAQFAKLAGKNTSIETTLLLYRDISNKNIKLGMNYAEGQSIFDL